MFDLFVVFFFFQAEDGIRDGRVTGVQTCALPISRQQITMINGWPGEGKTSVVIDIVARMTRGEQLPDGTKTPHPLRVMFLSTEDSESILHLRLRAAGADMSRVFTVPDTKLRHLTLPSHRGTWV